MSDEKPADTFKVSLHTSDPVFHSGPLGPFRYAIVGGLALELKDGKWVDKQGQEYILSLNPPTPQNKAAHRP